MSDLPFEWMGSTVRADGERTLLAHETEIHSRALLLAKLGHSKKDTERRLKRYLTWEYEPLGKAKVGKKVATLVADAFRLAGRA